jgi:hypothetical protein
MSMPFVFLWDAARHGTPKSYEQALEMWDELYHRTEKEETVSEKLVAFGEEFGQFIDNSGEESWLNVLAGTGAYVRRCRSAVLRLELPDTDWQPVLVKMVEVANKHGLVALHEDGVSLFLPNGKVLPANRAKTWKALQAALKQEGGFPQTLAQFKKWLTPQVEMMLTRHGEWVKGNLPWGNGELGYVKSVNDTKLYIAVDDYGGGGRFCFDVIFFCSHPLVESICRKFRFISPEIVFWGGALTSILGYSSKAQVMVMSAIEAMTILNNCEEAIFPSLDSVDSLRGLDDLLNGVADIRYRDMFHNYVYKPQCLIVARLAGNPNFETLAEELAVETGWYGNEDVWKEEWPKLVKYLREEVQPIV